MGVKVGFCDNTGRNEGMALDRIIKPIPHFRESDELLLIISMLQKRSFRLSARGDEKPF